MGNPLLKACLDAHQECIRLVQDLQQLHREDQQPWIPSSSDHASDPLSKQALKLVERSVAFKAAQQTWFEMLTPTAVEVRKAKRQLELDLDLQASVPIAGPVAPALPVVDVLWTCKMCPADNTDSPLRTQCLTGKLVVVNKELKLSAEDYLCKPCGDWLYWQLGMAVKRWQGAKNGKKPSTKEQDEEIKALIKRRKGDPRRAEFVMSKRRLRNPAACAVAPVQGKVVKRSKR